MLYYNVVCQPIWCHALPHLKFRPSASVALTISAMTRYLYEMNRMVREHDTYVEYCMWLWLFICLCPPVCVYMWRFEMNMPIWWAWKVLLTFVLRACVFVRKRGRERPLPYALLLHIMLTDSAGLSNTVNYCLLWLIPIRDPRTTFLAKVLRRIALLTQPSYGPTPRNYAK